MQYSNAYLREVLPREDPPLKNVPVDVIDEIERWGDSIGEDRELIARSTLWTYAIYSELGLGRYRSTGYYELGWRYPPWMELIGLDTKRVSFGLYDPEVESQEMSLIMDVPL